MVHASLWASLLLALSFGRSKAEDLAVPGLWSGHPELRHGGAVLIGEDSGWLVVAVGGAELNGGGSAASLETGTFVAEQIALDALVAFVHGEHFTVSEFADTWTSNGESSERTRAEIEAIREGLVRRAVRTSIFVSEAADSVFVSIACSRNADRLRSLTVTGTAVSEATRAAIASGVPDVVFRECLCANGQILTGGVAICSCRDTARLMAVGCAPLADATRGARVNATRVAAIDAQRRLASFLEGQDLRGIERGIEILSIRNDRVISNSYADSISVRNRIRGWVDRPSREGSWVSADRSTLYVVLSCDLMSGR